MPKKTRTEEETNIIISLASLSEPNLPEELQDSTSGHEGPAATLHAPRKKIQLTEEQEEDLAYWLRDNPCIYDKSQAAYKDTAAKNSLFEEKARSMEPPMTGSDLKTWYTSTRTTVGRSKKKLSGAGVKSMTYRDMFIRSTFSFLQDYIRVNRGQQAEVSEEPLSLGLIKEARPAPDSGDESDGTNMSDGQPISPSAYRPISRMDTSFRKRKKRKTGNTSVGSHDVLLNQMQHLTAALNKNSAGEDDSPQHLARKSFISSLSHDLLEVPEDLWMDFQHQFFSLVMDVKMKHLSRRSVPAPSHPTPGSCKRGSR